MSWKSKKNQIFRKFVPKNLFKMKKTGKTECLKSSKNFIKYTYIRLFFSQMCSKTSRRWKKSENTENSGIKIVETVNFLLNTPIKVM